MPYNLSEAFEAIEDELIGSMTRNLKRHQAEETDLGFEWEQWQALQLKALEDYRRRNLKKFPPRFNKLNLQIDEMLRASYKDGRTAQERRILKAIQKGFKPSKTPYSGEMELEGGFFGVNDRKLDALIEATTHDIERAEYAVLRRADDRYRQTIFNAQVYANTGAGTYEKAVDMATRDFLRAGLDCVEYKNGSRHTLEDYADMAIKTANKRAYLQGEGSMRDEWGVPTVIMNKRNCPCPLCAPFVGKVFIDDVWSGADKSGISPVTGLRYPLMSDAIAQGLYHPRCKDVHSTYFEGISTPPEGSQYTADELDEMAQQYEAEQKQGYCERQEKRYDRMSRYSLDEDNQRIYGARAKAFGEKAEQFGKVAKSFEKPVEKSAESGIINIKDVQTMSINSIDMPIEQRNTGKGNPNAILTFGIELNNRQKRLIEKLTNFDSRITVPKKSVSMNDLSALTAYTGDEFALFTKGNERLIIRGNAVSVNIDIEQAKQMAQQGYRWSGHTHPGVDFNCLFSSDGDRTILKQFEQNTSVIYNSKGQFLTFALEE